ncbi:MAG: NUDIX domain-containing protein [Patescibacteria group bacterium]
MSTGTTDPQAELLIQVDEDNQIIGSIDRHTAHSEPGIYYRTISVLIFNSDDEVLVQKRSPTKDLFPNCWDLSVGGHVNFGKEYLETAVREVGEEMGLQVSEADLIEKGAVLVHLPHSGEFFKVYEYHLKPGEHVKASVEEVADTAWMTIDQMKQSMQDKSRQWYARPEQIIAALY